MSTAGVSVYIGKADCGLDPSPLPHMTGDLVDYITPFPEPSVDDSLAIVDDLGVEQIFIW